MKKLTIFSIMLTLAMAVSSCCGNNNNASATKDEATTGIKIITAHKFIKAEMVDEFIEFTRPIIALSRAEEGCISYTLYQDPSDPTRFMFYEEWKDQAAIDFHFSTEHFALSGSRAADFEAAPTILKIYDASEVAR